MAPSASTKHAARFAVAAIALSFALGPSLARADSPDPAQSPGPGPAASSTPTPSATPDPVASPDSTLFDRLSDDLSQKIDDAKKPYINSIGDVHTLEPGTIAALENLPDRTRADLITFAQSLKPAQQQYDHGQLSGFEVSGKAEQQANNRLAGELSHALTPSQILDLVGVLGSNSPLKLEKSDLSKLAVPAAGVALAIMLKDNQINVTKSGSIAQKGHGFGLDWNGGVTHVGLSMRPIASAGAAVGYSDKNGNSLKLHGGVLNLDRSLQARIEAGTTLQTGDLKLDATAYTMTKPASTALGNTTEQGLTLSANSKSMALSGTLARLKPADGQGPSDWIANLSAMETWKEGSTTIQTSIGANKAVATDPKTRAPAEALSSNLSLALTTPINDRASFTAGASASENWTLGGTCHVQTNAFVKVTDLKDNLSAAFNFSRSSDTRDTRGFLALEGSFGGGEVESIGLFLRSLHSEISDRLQDAFSLQDQLGKFSDQELADQANMQVYVTRQKLEQTRQEIDRLNGELKENQAKYTRLGGKDPETLSPEEQGWVEGQIAELHSS